MFSIKIDIMRESAELSLVGTQGETQLAEFVRELEETVDEGAMPGRTILYDRSAARLMSCRNERWLTRIQELLLKSGATKIAEIVAADEPQTLDFYANWQRFEKATDAQSWLVRRAEELAA